MVFVTKFDFLKWGKENDLPLNKIDYQFIFLKVKMVKKRKILACAPFDNFRHKLAIHIINTTHIVHNIFNTECLQYNQHIHIVQQLIIERSSSKKPKINNYT
jgi:hypothetical protein